MKKIIAALLICTILSLRIYADEDDHHMGSAYVWVPVMIVMMTGMYFIFHRHDKKASQEEEIHKNNINNNEVIKKDR
ncbi:MAG: hypothetical protein ABII27_09130 [bacterium]